MTLCLCAAAARAEPDAADYQVEAAATTGRAGERRQAEIAHDREQAALQARLEAEREAQRRAQAAADEARRPYPQRLLQARCTLCHAADHYLAQRHGTLGWHAVIARMRLLNHAPIAWREQLVLAAELTRQRPAAALETAAEWGTGAAALALPPALAWRWRRRHRRVRAEKERA